MFSRRSFIKAVGAVAAGLSLPKVGKAIATKPVVVPVSEPIRYIPFHKVPSEITWRIRSKSLARALLLTDELWPGYLAAYDSSGVSYVGWYNKGRFNKEVVCAQQVVVPTYDMSPAPVKAQQDLSISYEQVKEAAKWFIEKENNAIIELLQEMADLPVYYGDTIACMNAAFRAIEQHDEIVTAIVCNERGLKWMKDGDVRAGSMLSAMNCMEPTTSWYYLKTNAPYSYWTADIFVVDDERLNDSIYLMPNDIGAMIIRQGITCLNDVVTTSLVIYDEAGFVFYRPERIVKVEIKA